MSSAVTMDSEAFGVGLDPPVREALRVLLKAYHYARDVGCSAWDFAVEVDRLFAVGLSHCDLRWLACRGYTLHAPEVTAPPRGKRRFEAPSRLIITDDSSVILTDLGARLATTLSDDGVTDEADAFHRAAPTLRDVSAQPSWNADSRELYLGHTLIKRFRVPAPNQELILNTFEEEGWPRHIDDPLPPSRNICPKRRLQASVISLNRCQQNRLIQFSGDGRGTGIRWHPIQ